MNAGEQISLLDLGIWCGKTYQEPRVPEPHQERISESYLKRRQELPTVVPQFLDCRAERVGLMQGAFWEMDGLSLGEYTMHSFGEYPKDVRESLLSQILEEHPLPKYSLSDKACRGILNRAKKRGKVLPKILEDALMQSAFKNGQAETGGVKEYSSKLNEPEHSQHSKISTYVIEGNGTRLSHNGDGYAESDVSYTLNATEQHCIAFSQDAYDTYSQSDVSATIKQSGGVYGGGSESLVTQ